MRKLKDDIVTEENPTHDIRVHSRYSQAICFSQNEKPWTISPSHIVEENSTIGGESRQNGMLRE